MIQYITGSDVAAEVRMTRAGFPGTVLIVEGDHDCRIYERFASAGDCRVIPAHGKTNAVDAITIIQKARMPGVLAIVDADFWHILGVPHNLTDIIPTDAHDIEVIMVESQALDVVLREYGVGKKIKAFITANRAAHLRDVLLARALPLGLLRLVSEENSLRLKFKGLDYSTVVSRTSLHIDEKALVREIMKLTRGHGITTIRITKLLKQARKRRCDARQACSGHDVTAITAIALQHAIGGHKIGLATAENVERWLRMSYDLRAFKTTDIYRQTKAWEAANTPYKVFQA